MYLLVLSFLTRSVFGHSADEIKHLPGLNRSINFRQYSGYLKGGQDIYLHYWFIESQSDSAMNPVLLWLNGGPVASGLMSLFTENGPFRVTPDNRTVTIDPNSWNTLANILYLETPAGVGYSYSTNNEYCANDQTTAQANYLALQDFFAKFPRFSGNPFYITGRLCPGLENENVLGGAKDSSASSVKGLNFQ